MTGPGVIVTTGAVAGPSSPTRAPSGQYFAVGLAERGPTDRAVLVNSFAEFVSIFGNRTTYSTLYEDLSLYFHEGGTRAYVTRVVGGAATIGAAASPLLDRDSDTPIATLNVKASSAGSWSLGVSFQVLDGSETNTFRIQVRYGGILVEDHTNLHSPQEAVAKVNARSAYIQLTDAASTSTPPDNNPAAQGSPVTLTAGTDDRAAVVAANYVTALARFEKGFGDGAVAIPGVGAGVHAGLIAHADANNRLALLSTARGADTNTLISLASGLNAQRAGVFAPWVRVDDGFGGSKAISPEGFVAAARSKAHELVGPWKAAAGETSKASGYVTAPDQVFDAATGSLLDQQKVNVIRTVAGTVRLYGWRSSSGDFDNWAYLTGADVVNRVVTEAEKQLEPYLFGVIDSSGHLLATIRGTLIGIVLPIATAGGLFARLDNDGNQVDPGYSVVTDDTVNPVASLALNQVLAKVGIRVSPTAAVIFLDVTKAAVTAAL